MAAVDVFHFGEADSPYERAAAHFCALCAELPITPARASSSMTEHELVRQIISGRIVGGIVTTGAIAHLIPSFYVADLPYVFADAEQAARFWKRKSGAWLVSKAYRAGLVVLTFYDAGTRHFFNRVRPATAPHDFDGFRIRILPNRYHEMWIEALGARPIPLPSRSLRDALRAHEIEGAERSYLNYADLRCLQVAPYFSPTRHFQLSACLVISAAWWETLGARARRNCEEAASVSEHTEREAYRMQDDEARRKLEQAGLVVTDPDISAFRDRARSVTEAFAVEEDGIVLLQAALEA